MDSKKWGWASSSANPEKISLTIKSFIPLILFILPMLGVIDITQNDILEAVDRTGAAMLAVMTAYGAIRRIKNLMLNKK